MEKTADFTELIVWQKAHQFVLETDIAISERGTLWNHQSNKESVGFDCRQHR
jgi:hypothetical protein